MQQHLTDQCAEPSPANASSYDEAKNPAQMILIHMAALLFLAGARNKTDRAICQGAAMQNTMAEA